ncbi:Fe-S protein assembly co-chaperone HscB [Kangiella shandongensis]|uniref:Fe-S protein assembly co-chaperone HscB n=1 Tax=Kangiella shandongensis TaxID=2763258 RepID=UPI001CBDBAE8|nr:Fe-S protein assembly co-chaperone HscB [Kangiella shandongensis]
MASAQQNYFELFGLEPNFFVDQKDLSDKLRRLLHSAHPDRHASGGSQQQMLAMQKTTRLNDAFAVLKHPVKRAQYLLQVVKGIDTTKDHTVDDPEFLMQQLELREELHNITGDKDATALMDFADKIEQMAEVQEAELGELFKQDAWDIDALKVAIYKLQFLYKTLHDIELAEDKILD